jgi:hypothetical protein
LTKLGAIIRRSGYLVYVLAIDVPTLLGCKLAQGNELITEVLGDLAR